MNKEVRSIRSRIPEAVPTGLRIDRYISETLGIFSRSQVKRRVLHILVNGKEVKLGRRLRPGDLLEVFFIDPPEVDLSPEAIELDIIFEDRNVLVINKPPGMVVHPGSGNHSGTLVNALLHYCGELKDNFGAETIRPGIVHRLDKDTSGIIIVAKNPAAREMLAGQFRRGQVRKQYLAIVKGSLPGEKGRIETRICRDPHQRKRFIASTSTGRPAITFYRALKAFTDYTLVSLQPKTGRTHQLRVHMKYLGCPILGDPIYGRKSASEAHSLMLHAYRLSIRLPGSEGQEAGSFRAPLPKRFREFILKGSL